MFSRIFCFLAVLVALAHASGDFVLLHTPDTVIFKGNKEIDQSLLKEVFSAALGFTVKQKTTWNGMSITNPFNLPEAVVAVAIEGVDSLGPIKGKKFPLNVDEVEETTWQALSGRLEERDNDNSLVRIYLGDGLDALGHSALGELKPASIDESSLQSLSLNKDEDRKFLEEVQLLRAIAKKVPTAISADGKSDVYWLVVSGLKPVYDVHGKNSVAAKEALTLLNEALHEINKAFTDVYKNQVLIAAFTNDASQVRHTRSTHQRQRRDLGDDKGNTAESNENERVITSTVPVPEEEEDGEKPSESIDNNAPKPNKDSEEPNKDSDIPKHDSDKPKTDSDVSNKDFEKAGKDSETDTHTRLDTPNHNEGNKENNYDIHDVKPADLNVAPSYSDDYPVIFNIILWFGVAFFFSLLAICITIAEMDPGRDSIIYRMTSNRMKKDN